MKIILDEFTHTDLTRQQRYQFRHERDGLCRLCPDLVVEGSKFCADHQQKQRVWCAAVKPEEKKTRTSPPKNYNPADLI